MCNFFRFYSFPLGDDGIQVPYIGEMIDILTRPFLNKSSHLHITAGLQSTKWRQGTIETNDLRLLVLQVAGGNRVPSQQSQIMCLFDQHP